MARLVHVVETEYSGKLHALVNNAGIASGGEALIVPLEASERAATVNLLGTMRMAIMLLPLLWITPDRGSSSCRPLLDSGLCGEARRTARPTSEIEGYARVLRDELGVFDVQVSVITPGLTRTNLIKSSMQSIRDNFEACPEKNKKLLGLDLRRKG